MLVDNYGRKEKTTIWSWQQAYFLSVGACNQPSKDDGTDLLLANPHRGVMQIFIGIICFFRGIAQPL
ncbi:hypothetical protein C7293_08800 [filamentous cyanobacterium CCT1]|nr:hypothetical protein C7293_08800 [filamentous cyanobacterium CCT1]PSN79730.1 hypothetical protein C8B47_10225 [filamentous cyanobacterium CCP4]